MKRIILLLLTLTICLGSSAQIRTLPPNVNPIANATNAMVITNDLGKDLATLESKMKALGHPHYMSVAKRVGYDDEMRIYLPAIHDPASYDFVYYPYIESCMSLRNAYITFYINSLQELQVLHTQAGYGIGEYRISGINDEDSPTMMYDEGTKYIYFSKTKGKDCYYSYNLYQNTIQNGKTIWIIKTKIQLY